MALQHKVDWGPGFQYFHCSTCGNRWREKSRYCESPSEGVCPNCNDRCPPRSYERHYEWPTDRSGNLIFDAVPHVNPHSDLPGVYYEVLAAKCETTNVYQCHVLLYFMAEAVQLGEPVRRPDVGWSCLL